MVVKYQVFISSTYSDLIVERQAVVEAVLGVGHIPAGMELFAAGSDSQLVTIKKWILKSDIFILLLGGRYGTLEPKSKFSYTEIEYRYAKQLNKPFFALLMDDKFLLEKIRAKSELEVKELENPEKYMKFKKSLQTKMVRPFSGIENLKYLVSTSINNITQEKKLQGWIRSEEVITRLRILNENSEINFKSSAEEANYDSINLVKSGKIDGQNDIRLVIDYGVRITLPQNGAHVETPLFVSGLYKIRPPLHLIYCFEYNPYLKGYWQKGAIDFTRYHDCWTHKVPVGIADDKERIIVIVAMGHHGYKAIEEYLFVNNTDHISLPLEQLSDDIIIIDKVSIIAKKVNVK